MSIFNTLKSAIFVEEPKEAPQPSTPSQITPTQTIGTPSATVIPTSQAAIDQTSVLDTAALELAIHAQIKAAQPFAPFNTFLGILESLSSIIPDEATRFKSAIAASKIDPATLLVSVKTYEEVLAQEAANFTASFIQPREQTAIQIKQQIDSLSAQIAQLNEQLAALNESSKNLQDGLLNTQTEVAKSKIDFDMVSSKIKTFYTTLVATFTKYSGAV